MFGISIGKTLVLTEPIKFRVGGSVQTAFWKVRNEPFGSRLCQDGSSERKSPGSAESESVPFFLGPSWGPTRPGFRQLFRG